VFDMSGTTTVWVVIVSAGLLTFSVRGSFLLVAGRPVTTQEAISVVSRMLRRRLYLRIVESWNSTDIVFTPSARASGFRSRTIAEGVRGLHPLFGSSAS
jgi:hypothetical protein